MNYLPSGGTLNLLPTLTPPTSSLILLQVLSQLQALDLLSFLLIASAVLQSRKVHKHYTSSETRFILVDIH